MKDVILNCLSIRRLLGAVLCLNTLVSFQVIAGEIKRAPANYVPDDDMIVVPVVVERNFYEEFNAKHKDEFRESRQKLEHWITQEQYAKDYGLEDAGFIDIPTAEQKEKFLKRNYLRFIQKDVERNNNETLQNWARSWKTDDEINSIRENERREEFIVKAKRSRGQKVVKAEKEVKVAGQKFKLDIQPRLEMGMVKIRLKSKYIEARAWLGVNGNQEVLVEKSFQSTGTYAMVNHYIEQSRTLAAIDQRLADHWSLRLTHEKYTDNFDAYPETGNFENNILSVQFGMGF